MDQKKVVVIGTGYVGGVSGTCLAEKGHYVTCVDSSEEKIEKWKGGNPEKFPVYEPGLDELVLRNHGKTLFFSSDIEHAIAEAEIIFVCVNTPTKEEGIGKGSFDLRYVEHVSRQIAKYARGEVLVVEKSTVPLKTAERIGQILRENGNGARFHTVSNPEFLAEGSAVQDFLQPDRVLIGTHADDGFAREKMEQLYYFVPKEKVVHANVWSSELTKLMNNAGLVLRITQANSITALCEQSGADVTEVMHAVGMDKRIGPHFLRAGIGFGGSCFRKDVNALIYLLKHYNLDTEARLYETALEINDKQRKRFVETMHHALFSLSGKEIAAYGFSFKPNTNDIRDAPSITVCDMLLNEGASLRICDPKAASSVNAAFERHRYKENIALVTADPYGAARGADAIALITEWDCFRPENADYMKIFESMRKPAWVFDGRLMYDGRKMQEIGFKYYGIGRQQS